VKNENTAKKRPFGINFLETPTVDEQKDVNGGKKAGGGTKLHSMDIFRSHGVWHYNT